MTLINLVGGGGKSETQESLDKLSYTATGPTTTTQIASDLLGTKGYLDHGVESKYVDIYIVSTGEYYKLTAYRAETTDGTAHYAKLTGTTSVQTYSKTYSYTNVKTLDYEYGEEYDFTAGNYFKTLCSIFGSTGNLTALFYGPGFHHQANIHYRLVDDMVYITPLTEDDSFSVDLVIYSNSSGYTTTTVKVSIVDWESPKWFTPNS